MPTCHAVSDKPWNDIVVDAHGNAYVNTIGFDFPGGEPAPGQRRAGHAGRRRPHGRRRSRLPQWHGDHRRRRDVDRGRVLWQSAHGLRHRSNRRPDKTADVGGDRRTTTPTASASTPTGPSGTPTWETDTACGCAKAARFLTRSNSIAAPSPAYSAAAISSHSSMSCARSGAARSHHQSRPGRSSRSRPRRLAPGSLRARCPAGTLPGRGAERSRR